MQANTVKATNKATGEVVELEVNNLDQLQKAWLIAKEYEKTSEDLKKQLKELVPNFLDDNGKSPEINGHVFSRTVVQRYTYDKAVMRQVLDEDTFDVLLVPDKTKVDKYIKENLESLGDASTELRKTMVPAGNSYEVINLTKVVRK